MNEKKTWELSKEDKEKLEKIAKKQEESRKQMTKEQIQKDCILKQTEQTSPSSTREDER